MSTPLLRAAFERNESKAHQEWIHWRGSVDLNAFSPEDFATLPLLSRRLAPWIENDSSKAILLGICKQAWSRNQTLLGKLVRVCGQLKSRNLHPVITGTPAAALLANRAQTGISLGIPRLSKLDLLLPVQDIPAAIETLRAVGWQSKEPAVRNSISQIYLADAQNDVCTIRWRLLSTPPSVASEYAAIPKIELEYMGAPQTVADPAWLLAYALTQSSRQSWLRRAWFLLECGVDWDHLQCAFYWSESPQPALSRTKILEAESGRSIPVTPPPHRSKLSSIRHDYAAVHEARENQIAGLLPYLRARWSVHSNARLPGLALRMAADWIRRGQSNT
ncbi:MAG: hypothetical protein ABL995_13990 [Bryobacteraceae bacterium]